MKIFFIDNPYYKTTKHILKHWQEKYEVKTDLYFDPVKAEWADVIYIEWCEGTIIEASKLRGHYDNVISDHKRILKTDFDWSGKNLINRIIDIDAYYGHFRQVQWQNVNHLVYIAKHIFNRVNNEMHFAEKYPNLKTTHIPLGIDLDAWSFKDRTKTHGKNIAFVNHLWTGKNIPLALQILAKLVTLDKNWKLWLVGNWSNEAWLRPYIEYFVKSNNLENNIVFSPRVSDVNAFLDNMDYTLTTSSKEAFSLITAEAMAKGIKPLIHNWEGAMDIYNHKYIFNTVDKCIEMCYSDYNSNEYREEVKKYDKKYELEAVDNLLK